MDKKKSLINVSVAIISRIILLVLTILTRRYLIICVGNEANGLNSLYHSIIGVLSIAELGIGSAITFSMYKPIVENQKEKVASLYNLFTKIYIIIGIVISLLGILVIPFLPILAKGYTISANLYITYFIVLTSVALTYMFSAKLSLINAYKNDYITTGITSLSQMVMQVIQIVLLVVTKSFEIFLLCRFIAVLIQWTLIELVSRKKHSEILAIKSIHLDDDDKREITKNIKAMFMHKIGGLLVNTVDSIVISSFIGIAVLGSYSNYVTIVTSMASILTLFFTPLTSIVGHLCTQKNIVEEKKYFNFFFTLNFIIGLVFYLGYYAVIDDAVRICFGPNLELDRSISFVVTLNYFIQFIRHAVVMFRDATGTFYNDRWKPLFEGIANLILSIILVKFIGVAGVIVATIITNVLICHIVEPYVLYKNVFKESPKKYYIQNYLYMIIFVLLMTVMTLLMQDIDGVWKSLFINGLISIGISSVPCVVILIINKEFRNKCSNLTKPLILKIKGKFIKQKNS